MRKEKLTILSGDIDQFLELTVPAYFMMMQTIATNDAENNGIGKSETLDKGLSWVISRIEVDFVSHPKYTEEVEMQTYPGDDLKVIFPRYFSILDKSGNTMVKSSSIWAVLNRETREPVANPFNKSLPAEHYEGEQPLPRKVKIPDDISLVEARKVRYSDIDLNGHLNNTKYMDYILDVHDTNFYKKNRIKHLLINYAHEVMDNQVIDLYSNHKNPEIIVGKIGEQLIFATEITYEER